ncbi:MAG: hypothetical protein KDC85_24155 [Saprospiraceae bacterium]|nr:hypothetical protein [Saprospiraceae bacterium]MCB9323681.1 hypothetical protein [Lewinellaceae bacterium]
MKKFILLLAFFGAFALNYSNAQTASTSNEATVMAAADKAAAADASIVVKTCEHSGTKTYYKKTTAEETGKVTLTKVTFNAATGSFGTMPAHGAGCSDAAKASCGSKAEGAKSGCCAGGDKSSCSGKGKVKTK